jgi:hypothetical protein
LPVKKLRSRARARGPHNDRSTTGQRHR